MGLLKLISDSFIRPESKYQKKFKEIGYDIMPPTTNSLLSYKFPESSPIFHFFENASWYWKSDYKNAMSYITPYDFLKLSATGNPNESTYEYFINQYEENGDIKFRDIPFFSIKMRNGQYEIKGHEGRHRASMMIMMGYGDDIMPVRLSSNIWISTSDSLTTTGQNPSTKYTFKILKK